MKNLSSKKWKIRRLVLSGILVFPLFLISYILSPISTRAAAPTAGMVGYGPCDIGSVFDGNITGWNFDPVKYQQSWSANAEFYRVDPVKYQQSWSANAEFYRVDPVK